VVSSPLVRGPRLTANGDGTTTAEDDPEAEDLPPTPEDVQINAADVDQFDQTYLAQSQNFKIEGEFSPAPFPLQVLPRVAYTINYNFVYNDSRGRWEPQKKSNQGIDTGTFTIPNVSAPPDGTWDTETTTDVTVSFNRTFSEVPKVYLTIQRGDLVDAGVARVINRTNSEFTARALFFKSSLSGVETEVAYLAVL
jgi:hypothetical protein